MIQNNWIQLPQAFAGTMKPQHNTVIVFSTPYCHYCTLAKELLDKKGIHYIEKDVMEAEGRAEMLKCAPGSRTVPQIVIGDEHIGGYAELRELAHEGKLEGMVAGKSQTTKEKPVT